MVTWPPCVRPNDEHVHAHSDDEERDGRGRQAHAPRDEEPLAGGPRGQQSPDTSPARPAVPTMHAASTRTAASTPASSHAQ
jgi:hypothetical protein